MRFPLGVNTFYNPALSQGDCGVRAPSGDDSTHSSSRSIPRPLWGHSPHSALSPARALCSFPYRSCSFSFQREGRVSRGDRRAACRSARPGTDRRAWLSQTAPLTGEAPEGLRSAVSPSPAAVREQAKPAALPGARGSAQRARGCSTDAPGTHLTSPGLAGRSTAAKAPRRARPPPETAPGTAERGRLLRGAPTSDPGAQRGREVRAAHRCSRPAPRGAVPEETNKEPSRPERQHRRPVDTSQGSSLSRKTDPHILGSGAFLASSVSVSGGRDPSLSL